jgi:hypothetical protein
MKKYLIKMHAAAAEHHVAMAKSHKRIAALHATAADSYSLKSASEVMSDCHRSIAGEHDDCAKCHADAADFHVKCAKALEATGDEGLPDVDREDRTNDADEGLRAAAGAFGMRAARDFSKIRPDGAHLVMPSDVPGNVHLIGRPGSAPATDVSKIDPQFQDLVRTD